MSNQGNGHNGRIYDLNASRIWSHTPKPIGLTPDQARALIDRVFHSYGLDALKATDSFGWRHLSLGSALGVAGVAEWQPGEFYLVVVAPILEVPADAEGLASVYKTLLELNHDGTLAARFSILDDVVYVSITRPIRGLDEQEIDDALRAVMIVADSYDDWLQAEVEASLDRLPLELPELPDIKMRPREAQAIGRVLAACDPHGEQVFRYMMERWVKNGYIVRPIGSSVGLQITLGARRCTLAGLRPGVGDRRQLIILGWEGLRKQTAFPGDALDRFQTAVLELAEPKITESTAHIEVTVQFDQPAAAAMLRELATLANAARPVEEAGDPQDAAGAD